MNTAEALVKLLEEDGVRHIFGHPGEQILPFYMALKDSSIEHILTRHEQGAAHAADSYARSSGKFGLCISTAGPGAMNLVMGVATAYKDSVPLLVITGDNSYSQRGQDIFQSSPINAVFNNISIKSFYPHNGKVAIANLKEALEILHKEPKGPIHINLAKDVLLDSEIGDMISTDLFYTPNYDCSKEKAINDEFELAIEKLKLSKKPLILAGNGVIWGQAISKLNEFVNKTHIPIATTYHSKGIIDENEKFNLGMLGLRGTAISNYAWKNSDLILVLGAKLSERTIAATDNFQEIKNKIIHININKDDLKGKIKICADVSFILDYLLGENFNSEIKDTWIEEIYENDQKLIIEGIANEKENIEPLKPQFVINKIINQFEGSYFISDAGTHTTWTTLLSKSDKFGKLLFSGGFGPMGYGLAGAIGVAICHPDEKVVVICGDGDIQMVIQELATIKEYGLNISIFVLNNSQLGIIRQWEENIYNESNYQVDLKNPDFPAIAKAYGIDSKKVVSLEDLELAIVKSFNSKNAYLIDVDIAIEDIPLAK